MAGLPGLSAGSSYSDWYAQQPGETQASLAVYPGITPGYSYDMLNAPSAGGSGGSYDPYAAQRSVFNAQKANIYGTARGAAEAAASSRGASVLDYIDSLNKGQRDINERGVQNELRRKQGYTSILDMVGRGVGSLGTLLGSRNAASGSALGQLTGAYGNYGKRMLQSNVNNPYELENRNIGFAQQDFDTQKASGLRRFEAEKQQQVNSIVLQARDRLASLDAAMAEASLPERIQIEQEKEAIRSEALGILSQFDQQLASGAAGARASSLDERRNTAFSLANQGAVADNPFDFSTESPVDYQGAQTGLPIFTRPRRRE